MRFLPAVLTLLLFVCVTVGAVSADVLVFDKYDTVSKVSSNSIHIEREMTLTNVARNPVIPGELHFKIYEQDGTTKHAIKVSGFTAQNDRGTVLGTKIVNKADETDLSTTVWDPMLPGFSYTFRISYDMEFRPSGILFYELKIPQEDTTIAIKQSKQTVLLDSGYHVTYAPDTQVSQLSGNAVVSWAGQNDQQVIEYSAVPFPRIGIPAVNVFWGFVIVLLLVIFGLSVRRARAARATVSSGENGG